MTTKAVLVIRLGLPPKECSPNWRGHHMAKAKAVKAYRYEAFIEGLRMFGAPGAQMLHLPWEKAVARVTFSFKQRRRRDKDNLAASLKAAWDGLCDSRILDNDSGLTLTSVEIESGAYCTNGVTIRLKQA